MVPLSMLERGDLALEDRDRRQRHPGCVGGVAGGVHRRVRGALQVTGDADAALVPLDVGSVEVQAGEFGYSAGAMNDEVELYGLGQTGSFDADRIAVRGPLDRGDRRSAPQLDPRLSAPRDQELDQVGVEPLQGTGPRSMMTGALPAREQMWANSKEMKPPPTNRIRGGSTSRSKKSVLSTRCS